MRLPAPALGAFSAAALLAGAAPAAAHPHVFAEARMEIVGAPDGTLKSVRNVWRMDELFSSSVLFDFDQDSSGTLEEAELAEVGRIVKESIAEWSFYTFVKAGGRDVALVPPDEIRMAYENGQLLMFFEMAAAERIELSAQPVTAFNFDDTFYVAFDASADGSFALVDMPAGCHTGLVVPDEDEAASAWLDSIAALGPEEDVASTGEDYALLLATHVDVTCPA